MNLAPGSTCTTCGTPLKTTRRRKTTLCKTCQSRALGLCPERRRRTSATLKARLADPGVKAEHMRRCTEGRRRAIAENPEFAAQLREQGRQLGLLGKGFNRHGAGSPERALAGKRCSATKLAWCPLEYRDEYRHLVRIKLLPAADARAIIEQQVRADRARYFATGELQQAVRS